MLINLFYIAVSLYTNPRNTNINKNVTSSLLNHSLRYVVSAVRNIAKKYLSGHFKNIQLPVILCIHDRI